MTEAVPGSAEASSNLVGVGAEDLAVLNLPASGTTSEGSTGTLSGLLAAGVIPLIAVRHQGGDYVVLPTSEVSKLSGDDDKVELEPRVVLIVPRKAPLVYLCATLAAAGIQGLVSAVPRSPHSSILLRRCDLARGTDVLVAAGFAVGSEALECMAEEEAEELSPEKDGSRGDSRASRSPSVYFCNGESKSGTKGSTAQSRDAKRRKEPLPSPAKKAKEKRASSSSSSDSPPVKKHRSSSSSSSRSRRREKDKLKEKDKAKAKEKEREKAKEKGKEAKDKEKARDKEKDHDRDRDKEKKKAPDRDREKEKDREKEREKEKKKDKEKEKDREREKEKEKDKAKEKEKEKDKDRDRERDKDRDRGKKKEEREKDRDREKDRERRERDKEKEKERDRERDRDREKDKGRDKDDAKEKEKVRDRDRDRDSRRASRSMSSRPSPVPVVRKRRGGGFDQKQPDASSLALMPSFPGSGTMPHMPMGGLADPEVEAFLAANTVDPQAAARFRALPSDLQRLVLLRGSLVGTRDPSAVLMSRVRDAMTGGGMGMGMGMGMHQQLQMPSVPNTEVEMFLAQNPVDFQAASRLRALPPHMQRLVLIRGSLSGTRDPSSVLMSRVRDAMGGSGGMVLGMPSGMMPEQQPPNFRPGDWMCPKCNFHNYSSKIVCTQCATPMPGVVMR
eukprot:CAMPEP_0170653238 /NCGR_PEP_ID=MMETSP0224-20130122/47305_1 /TAXON_ID=285029 /ORGANISM="Togula jolla, Strain CCCM 725" /LENGTH=672 /DNA_ID=CAMNT_0010985105 /DNA_START=62 /DNA_END=2080 /DNA_ORIENTATION=-